MAGTLKTEIIGKSSDWMPVNLGVLFTLEYGKGLSEKQRNHGKFPVYGSSGIVGYHNEALIPGPGLIVGRKGTIGSVLYSENNFWPIDTVYYVKLLRENLDLKWLFFKLTHLNLSKYNMSDVVPGLKRELVYAAKIELPPLPEQRHIATILTTVDDAIQHSQQAVAETKRLKAGVMHELMTKGIGHIEFREDPDVGWVPKEWDVKPLDEMIEIIDCKHYTPTYVENGFPIVRPQNIGIDGIDFVSCANVSRQEFLLMNEKHSPKRGDIVYSRNASFGIPAYVDESREFCIGQDMVVMTESIADTKYIFFVLCSNNIQQQLKQQSGGSTIQRINLKDIRRLLIPEPSKVEQQQIANILTTLDHKITLQRLRTAHYEKLKQGLMNELLTGKRRVAVT